FDTHTQPSALYPLSLHDALPISTAAAVQNALQALSTIGVGNVSVSGASPLYTITFTGALANKDVSLNGSSGLNGAIAASTTLQEDRKSTRLNSSHRTISYAVFCL